MRKKMGVLAAALLLFFCAGCGQEAQLATLYDDEENLSNPYSNYSMDAGRQESDEQGTEGAFSRMNGMVMIWNYDAPGDSAMDIRYLLNVTGGSVKLVWIAPDKTVSTIVEIHGKAVMDDYAAISLPIKKGFNIIKLVGAGEADVEFEVKIGAGSFYNIKKK